MVTTTLAEPALPAGVVQVMVVESTTVTSVAATPLKVTAGAPVKSLPVMITLVPPAVLPLVGEMPVMAGATTTGPRPVKT